MDGWSSFADDKKITDNWRQFLGESAGIDSVRYPDSLINMLEPMVANGILTDDEKQELLNFMIQAATEDEVILEALGEPQRDIRTFSRETTEELNNLISSFGLRPDDRKNLESLFNNWARLNTVNFATIEPDLGLDTSELPPPATPLKPEMPLPPTSAAPPEPESVEDEEGEPDTDEEAEEEESGVIDKAMDTVKQKAQDLGVEIPDVEQVKFALDAISLAGVTGAGELVATPATIASLALNIATKDWDDALIDVVSLLPVAGKAFKLSAKSAKTAKAAKALATAAEVSDRAAKIADVVKKGKAVGNVAKNLGMMLGSRLDKKELQQVASIKDFIAKLADSGVFGDAPSELSEPFLDMMSAAKKAQRQKAADDESPANRDTAIARNPEFAGLAESIDRWQKLAGINKRVK